MTSWRRALTVAAVVGGVTAALGAQAGRVTPLQEVATLDDLRPKTSHQIVRAEMFKLDDATRQLLKGRLLIDRQTALIRETLEGETGSPQQILEAAVCRSPAVVVGQATSSQTFFTADEMGLFTDFSMSVDRWVRPAPGDREILVSMIGGRAVVAGTLRLAFQVNYFIETGQRYLMFLHWTEAAKAYFVDRQPVPVAGGKVIFELEPTLKLEDEDTFLKRLSSIAARCR